jgi:molybdenum cofactor cytidylyltransferase
VRHRHRVNAAIILAAGASTRLLQPKQLATLAGETLLDRAIRIANEAGCNPIIVVLGANADWVAAHCRLTGAVIVRNEGWAEGMASSVRAGLAAVAHADSAILMTCDMPAVTPTHLQALMTSVQVTASGYAGRRGVPAFFPAASFPALAQLTGDAGARALLQHATVIDLPGGELDIDTPDNLAAAHLRFGKC